MAKKVEREMATKITVDGVGAIQSLRGLNEAIKTTSSSFKAQESALKRNGDFQQAAATKVEGLSKQMELQKAKINELKARQEGLDQSTKSGQANFLKLSNEINTATNKMSGLDTQFDKAKNSMGYYNSGLAELQKGYREATQLSQSYVNRLEAEGKTADASKARLSGYTTSVENLSKQLKTQETELAKVASESGKTSEAYQRQEKRVNDTATSLAKAKTQMGELNTAMGKANASGFTKMLDGARNKLGLMRSEEKKTADSTKHIAIGSAIGTGISTAASSALSYMKSVTQEGYKMAEAGETIGKQWHNLGLSDSDGNKMLKQISDIRGKANIAGSAIDAMQKKFYITTGSAAKSRDLTNLLASYGSAANKSGDQIAQMAQGMGKLAGSAKVGANLFKKQFGQVPELQKAVVKASGMSTSAFNKQLAAGKLTGSKLQGYMLTAAKTSGKAWTEYGDTTKGQLAGILGTYSNLKAAFAKPMVAGISKAITGVTSKKGGLDSVRKSISKMVSALGTKTGEFVGATITFLTKNAKPLGAIASSVASIVGSFGKGVWQTVSGVIKDLGGHSKAASKGLSGVASATSKIASHRKAIQLLGSAFVTAFAIGKFLKFTSEAVKIASTLKIVTGAQWLFNAAMNANPVGLVVAAIAALSVGVVEAYKHIKPFRDAVNGIGHAMGKLFTGKYGWEKAIGKKLSGVGSTISKWGKGAGKFVSKHKTEILAGLVNPFAGLSAWFLKDTKTGKAVSKWAGSFTKDVKKMGFSKAMHKQVDEAGKAFSKSKFGKWWSSVSSSFTSWKKGFAKSWNKHWSDIGKTMKSDWDTSVKNTKGFFSSVNSKFGTWKKSWASSWSKHWDSTRKTLASAWTKSGKNTQSFYSGMGTWLGKFGKSFKSGWDSLGDGVKGIFADMWKSLKKKAQDGINGTLDIINGGIGLINGVIHSFGGNKTTISPLGHVKLATGTGYLSGVRKAISKPTMAVLNDGNDSPETDNKEMVFMPNGQSGVVQGRNTQMMLPAGSEVLNATETKMLMGMQGVEHYASGTGIGNFFSGIGSAVGNAVTGATDWVSDKVKGLKTFFKTAEKIIAHPVQSVESLFKWTNGKTKGVMTDLGQGMFKNTSKQVKNWWSGLWSMVDLDGGSATGGKWANTPGAGWSETSGFGYRGGGSGGESMHDGVDFGASQGAAIHAVHGGKVVRAGNPPAGWGPVDYSVVTKGDDGAYVIYQEFGTSKNAKVGEGDTVHTGSTIGTLGHNSVGTAPHVHIGVSKNYPFSNSGSTTKGWLDVTKMHGGSDDDDKKDSSPKASSGLSKLIKSQVGSGFWSFMKKLADQFGDSAGGSSANPSGASVTRWTDDIKKAMRANGISVTDSKVRNTLAMIQRESGGNPSARQPGSDPDGDGSGPALGLTQMKRMTFNGAKLSGHGNLWNGYDNLLASMHYIKGKYGTGEAAFARVAARGYANGGLINTNQLIEVAEKNKPEMVLPLTNKNRAFELIGQAVATMRANGTMTATSVKEDSKLDQVIQLLTALVGGQSQTVQAVIAKDDVVNAVRNDNQTKNQYSQLMGY